jgi:acyl carrier protein
MEKISRSEIADRVLKATARELNMSPSDIKETDNFAVELGADSLKSIELIAAFEEEFDLSVVEEDALKVQTVGGAIEFFDGLINKK